MLEVVSRLAPIGMSKILLACPEYWPPSHLQIFAIVPEFLIIAPLVNVIPLARYAPAAVPPAATYTSAEFRSVPNCGPGPRA
jgi:hypothetical protein